MSPQRPYDSADDLNKKAQQKEELYFKQALEDGKMTKKQISDYYKTKEFFIKYINSDISLRKIKLTDKKDGGHFYFFENKDDKFTFDKDSTNTTGTAKLKHKTYTLLGKQGKKSRRKIHRYYTTDQEAGKNKPVLQLSNEELNDWSKKIRSFKTIHNEIIEQKVDYLIDSFESIVHPDSFVPKKGTGINKKKMYKNKNY